MVSNRLLQECLEDFSNIMRLSMALYDRNRTCVAGDEESEPEADVFIRLCSLQKGNLLILKVAIRLRICRLWETAICLK